MPERHLLNAYSDSESERITALMKAAREAAMTTPDFGWSSVLRTAPSHTGAALLQALGRAGWELRKVDEPGCICPPAFLESGDFNDRCPSHGVAPIADVPETTTSAYNTESPFGV